MTGMQGTSAPAAFSPPAVPRGTALTCRSWLTEAPYRMLLNNLDPEVAERREDLVVYGGSGKAARNPACLAALGDLRVPVVEEHPVRRFGEPGAAGERGPLRDRGRRKRGRGQGAGHVRHVSRR